MNTIYLFGLPYSVPENGDFVIAPVFPENGKDQGFRIIGERIPFAHVKLTFRESASPHGMLMTLFPMEDDKKLTMEFLSRPRNVDPGFFLSWDPLSAKTFLSGIGNFLHDKGLKSLLWVDCCSDLRKLLCVLHWSRHGGSCVLSKRQVDSITRPFSQWWQKSWSGSEIESKINLFSGMDLAKFASYCLATGRLPEPVTLEKRTPTMERT